MEFLANLPEPLKWAGGILGAIATGFIFVRQYLSGAEAQRASDTGQIAALDVYREMVMGLREQLRDANARADQFAKERNEAVEQIGALRGQISELSRQVEAQAKTIEHLRDQIQELTGAKHDK